MDLISISELTSHATACGISETEAPKLAASIVKAVDQYHVNSRKGAYDLDGNLVPKQIYGEKIVNQKNQRRRKLLAYPSASKGRPPNPALRVLISSFAVAFTRAGGVVTLNQQGALDSKGKKKDSAFHSFIEPICNELGLFNVRDYIADHMNARKAPSIIFSSLI